MSSLVDTGRRVRLRGEQFAAATLLIAAIPSLLVTAFVVWWVLGQPILFTQTRAGLDAQPFTIRKFRTMSEDRDAAGALLPDNLRETRATRLLRRSKLDELPQLLTIMWGEMAFVGPRPILPGTVESWGELGRVRSSVLPGLTGWSQVSGNTRLSDAQKLALDIWYIDHKSWQLDCWIIWLTLMMIITGERVNRDRIARAEAHLGARQTAPCGV
jgi:lipopolysaccharide/colanic/teichoic acid biosynthesis glycosyltransferase